MLYDTRKLLLVSGVMMLASFSEAQVHRTFVGVLGNDLNDCLTSATACRTINAAVTKVDAEGEVIIVSTGSYAGAAITKSVRINAPSGIVAFAALPITINAVGANVAIRGFTIKAVTPGSGFGIDVTAVGTLLLERMVIDGWDRGLSIASAANVSISDSIFRNNTSFGAITFAAAKVSVVKSKFENNLNGFFVGSAGTGSISRSSATGNTLSALTSSGAGSVLAIDRCLSANNGGGVRAEAGGIARLSNSSISGNGTGVFNSGSTVESFFAPGAIFTNGIRGNTVNISGVLTAVALQ